MGTFDSNQHICCAMECCSQHPSHDVSYRVFLASFQSCVTCLEWDPPVLMFRLQEVYFAFGNDVDAGSALPFSTRSFTLACPPQLLFTFKVDAVLVVG